ncbi:MAG: hypothetical protein WAQ33_16470 [Gaiellaceae bacterium]
MDLPGERSDLLGQLLVLPRQVGVRLEELGELLRLGLDQSRTLVYEASLFLVVPLDPFFVVLVAVRLASLREQDLTRIVWPMMYLGKPKKRATRSAARPNVSVPNAPWRCSDTSRA